MKDQTPCRATTRMLRHGRRVADAVNQIVEADCIEAGAISAANRVRSAPFSDRQLVDNALQVYTENMVQNALARDVAQPTLSIPRARAVYDRGMDALHAAVAEDADNDR